MNIADIKKLAEIMKNYELSSIEVNGDSVSMKRECTVVASPVAPVIAPTVEVKTAEVKEEVQVGKIFTSPTVGVFYSSPAPDKDAFVAIGSKVKSGDIVCIIEAMKLMNEIQADFDGEIIEVFAKNGDVVEYGQNLFRYK